MANYCNLKDKNRRKLILWKYTNLTKILELLRRYLVVLTICIQSLREGYSKQDESCLFGKYKLEDKHLYDVTLKRFKIIIYIFVFAGTFVSSIHVYEQWLLC